MSTRKRTAKAAPAPQEQAPKTLDIDINVDAFTNADYEALLDWSSGNAANRPVAEIFDILDRVIVGGFRTRRFVDSKDIIQKMLQRLQEVANGGPKN
jgi:hypothetical protein